VQREQRGNERSSEMCEKSREENYRSIAHSRQYNERNLEINERNEIPESRENTQVNPAEYLQRGLQENGAGEERQWQCDTQKCRNGIAV